MKDLPQLDEDAPFIAGCETHYEGDLATISTLEAARRREEAVLALGELSARVAAGAGPAELPALAVRALRGPLGAAAAAVWLLDAPAPGAHSRDPMLRLAAQEGVSPKMLPDIQEIALSDDRLTARVAREGRTLALFNPRGGNDVPGTRAILEAAGYGLAVTAPLRAGGRILGALSLTFHDVRPAPADERAFVEAVATQVAAALENARLLAETRTQAARATLLADLAAMFNRSLDMPTLLATLARRTAEVLGGGAGVYRVREGREEFEVAAYHHRDMAVTRNIQAVLGELPPRPGIGVFGHAYLQGRPLLVRFDNADVPASQRIYAERHGATSTMAVPLVSHGRQLGVLAVTSFKGDRPFDEDDLALATAIANLAAQSLDNARAYAAAEKERRRLAATFESMVDAVFLLDAEGRIIDLNEAARRFIAAPTRGAALRPAAEYLPLLDLHHPDGRPLVPDDLPSMRAVRGETVVGSEQVGRRIATGEEYHAVVNAAPIYDDKGSVAGAVLVVRDVTAQRAAERAKDEFTNVAGHELKTPLTPIKGFVQIISDMVSRAEADASSPLDLVRLSRYLDMMDRRVDRLISLVEEMLDLSRLQKGSFPLEIAPADLVSLASEVLAVFDAAEEISGGSRHELVLQAPATLIVRCDAQRIEQVLTNLLANALKYSPDGGKIRLTVGQEGDQAALVVDDEGIGVPPGEEEALFQPFTRGSNAPSLQFAGVGLGLYICHEIVARHGGCITMAPRVTAGPGTGTAVRVSIPIAGPMVNGQGGRQ